MNADALKKEGVQFLRHSYPGARRPPNELVKKPCEMMIESLE